VLIGGCSDPEPKEPKATSSPTPTITVPTMPAQAKENSDTGSLAFVQYFVSEFNYAVNSGDSTRLKLLISGPCGGCQSYLDEIARSHAHSGEVRGFQWTVGKGTLFEPHTVEASIASARYETRPSKTSKWATVNGARYNVGFELQFDTSGWRVSNLYDAAAK